jgi:hypothetical protein
MCNILYIYIYIIHQYNKFYYEKRLVSLQLFPLPSAQTQKKKRKKRKKPFPSTFLSPKPYNFVISTTISSFSSKPPPLSPTFLFLNFSISFVIFFLSPKLPFTISLPHFCLDFCKYLFSIFLPFSHPFNFMPILILFFYFFIFPFFFFHLHTFSSPLTFNFSLRFFFFFFHLLHCPKCSLLLPSHPICSFFNLPHSPFIFLQI